MEERNRKKQERIALIMGPKKEEVQKTIGNYAVGK
jgi:hypothetical protein